MKTARREQLALAKQSREFLRSPSAHSNAVHVHDVTDILSLRDRLRKHILNGRISHGDGGKAEKPKDPNADPVILFPGIRRKNNGDGDLIGYIPVHE